MSQTSVRIRLLGVGTLALVVSADPSSSRAATRVDPMAAFARFVGSWDVKPKTPESGWPGSMVISQVAGRKALYAVLKSPQEVAGTPYETHTLWGYDYGTTKVHLYEVTSDGGAMDYAGELTANGDLVLRAPGFEDTSVELKLTWISRTEVRVQLIVRTGARFEETQSLVWRKTK